MLLTTITLLCLYTCPTDQTTIEVDQWDTHLTALGAVNRAWDQLQDQTPQDAPHEAVSDPGPSPQPKPVPRQHTAGTEQWRELVASYFPADQVEMALCVIEGESEGDIGADNPTSSAAGLWQFLKSTWDDMVPADVTGGSYSSGAVYDPVASTRAAAWLWAAEGWSQWNAAARC